MLLVILLIAHMIADFFLQSSKMAESKQEDFKALLVHSGIYLLVFAVVDFLFMQYCFAVWTTLIIASSHFIIDFVRVKFDNKFKSSKVGFLTFLFDQVLHITIVVITYYLFDLATKINLLYSNCKSYSDFDKIVLYCLLFVILLDPTAVLVKKSFIFLFKDEGNNNSGNNVGSTIGKLERVITAVLLLCNQYGAIGLVLTAKSIARFKQLEDQNFAEKYLIGTLLSLSVTLITVLIIKYVLTL